MMTRCRSPALQYNVALSSVDVNAMPARYNLYDLPSFRFHGRATVPLR